MQLVAAHKSVEMIRKN